MKKARSPWPYAIAAFFAVVFTVNFTFLYVAVATDDGLTDPDYYEKGLFYQARMDEQKRLGWRIALDFEGPPAAGQGNAVTVDVVDAEGRALDGAEVTVVLRRPTSDRFDRAFELEGAGRSSYTGRIEIPLPGYWDVRVRAETEGGFVEKTFRIEA